MIAITCLFIMFEELVTLLTFFKHMKIVLILCQTRTQHKLTFSICLGDDGKEGGVFPNYYSKCNEIQQIHLFFQKLKTQKET